MKKYIITTSLIVLIITCLFLHTKFDNLKTDTTIEITNQKEIKDDRIAVVIDGDPADEFPAGRLFDAEITCESGGTSSNVTATVSWVTNRWVASISGIKDGDVKCTVEFTARLVPHEGELITFTPQYSNTNSSGATTNNGYQTSTHQYKIATNYSSGGSAKTFSQENLTWKVWKVDGTNITLISTTPTSTTLSLNYSQGYNNALLFMNDICSKLYGGSLDGMSARSITMVDIWEKIFENKQTTTYNNSTINLVDNNGKALTSIITANSTDMGNAIKGLGVSTDYGFVYTANQGANRYVPRVIYDAVGASSNTTLAFVNYSALNNLENAFITTPTTNTTSRPNRVRPIRWSYTISNATLTSLLDATTLGMLQSSTNYWIATRDYYFANNNSSVAVQYNVKAWESNAIARKTIYVSNTTNGQTVLTEALRPMIELDLTKVQIADDGTVSAITN